MTTKSPMEKLLEEVLALQDEDGRGAELTEERLRNVLLGRDAFTTHEEHLLMTSPLARSSCAEVREDLRLEGEVFIARCRRAGIKTEVVLPLAASGGQDPLDRTVVLLPHDDCPVKLHRHPRSKGWIVSLTLSDRLREIIGPDGWLTLVDNQGVTWLHGQVNSYGEIHSYGLPSGGEDPTQLVRREGLRLRVRPG